MNRFNDQTSQSSQKSYRSNEAEQDRAIKSAEGQVSIANRGVKDATLRLTKRVDALGTAVNNYYSRLSELGVSSAPSDMIAGQVSKSASSLSARQSTEASASRSASVHKRRSVVDSVSSASASSSSSAASSSNSMSQVLVSLKSNVGVIYSLVNKKK